MKHLLMSLALASAACGGSYAPQDDSGTPQDDAVPDVASDASEAASEASSAVYRCQFSQDPADSVSCVQKDFQWLDSDGGQHDCSEPCPSGSKCADITTSPPHEGTCVVSP